MHTFSHTFTHLHTLLRTPTHLHTHTHAHTHRASSSRCQLYACIYSTHTTLTWTGKDAKEGKGSTNAITVLAHVCLHVRTRAHTHAHTHTHSDELASSALGGWNCKARATGGAEGSMHGAGHSSKREKGGDSQELRRHPSRVVSGKGAREDADEGARSVRRGAVDRAVDIDVAARALLAGHEHSIACLYVCVCKFAYTRAQTELFLPLLCMFSVCLWTAAQELLIIPPETASSFGQLPAVEEVKALFDSACVSVHCGTCLPLNDHEKKKCFTEVDEKGEKGGGGSISFDLASGLALDWWYRLIDQYQEHISQLWAVNEAYWDCGSNLSSPGSVPVCLLFNSS